VIDDRIGAFYPRLDHSDSLEDHCRAIDAPTSPAESRDVSAVAFFESFLLKEVSLPVLDLGTLFDCKATLSAS